MGIFNTLMGNATNVDAEKVQERLKDILFENENIEFTFSYVRDLIIFTTSRIILIDKQGISGKKESFESIPYRTILRFSVEVSGVFDMDSELKIWVSGLAEPIQKTFAGDQNVLAMQKFLAQKVCLK